MTLDTLAPPPTADTLAAPLRSPFRLALRRFLRNRLAVVGLFFIVALMLACFGSLPWTTARVGPDGLPNPTSGVARFENQFRDHMKEAPSSRFWMGTNNLGQDLQARFLLGGTISLSLGLASAAIAIIIGTLVGLIAGYAGGRIDAALMRIVDVLYGLPYILLVILMRVALVPSFASFVRGAISWLLKLHILNSPPADASINNWANFLVLLVGIGSVSWLTLARVVRGQVMSLREQPFVEAARALGYGWARITGRHILPNLIGTIIVYGTLTVPAAILSESFLSFLGLGIQPPIPSWGNLASEGMEALNPVMVRWWLITWPCAGLSLALLALNFLGDGIREAVDPKG